MLQAAEKLFQTLRGKVSTVSRKDKSQQRVCTVRFMHIYGAVSQSLTAIRLFMNVQEGLQPVQVAERTACHTKIIYTRSCPADWHISRRSNKAALQC